jgi:pilus assembly protein CpaC
MSRIWPAPLRRMAAATAICMLLVSIPAARLWAADALSLGVGAERVIDLEAPIVRIVLAQGGIVDASVQDDTRVQLLGLQAGRTSLAIFTAGSDQGSTYVITVGDPGTPRLGSAGASSSNAAGLPAALAAQSDLSSLQAHAVGGHVLLSGVAPDLQAHQKAMDIAHAYGGDSVVDATRVGGNQMVAIEIRFAAVAATTVDELGFNFQSLGSGFQGVLAAPNSITELGTAGAALTAGAGLPIASAFNLLLQGSNSKGNVLGMISALSQAGLTQLLAQPTLVVQSGERASFLAGGEVPIPVPQGGAASGSITIEYHKYGVKLEVAPTVLSDGRISMRVAPEVSEIDPSNALVLDGFSVPAFRERSTSTVVELGDGESFVIAGLLYNSNTLTQSSVPFLGDIPILGAFFKLSQTSRQRQELIVIATPHLVSPLDGSTLPPLPGEEISNYPGGVGAMLANTHTLRRALASYGLMN